MYSNKDQDLERFVKSELSTVLKNLIWRNDAGEYELFGKYRIVKTKNGYTVWCHATCVGDFSSTKTAVSWCVADKYQSFNLAREILLTDQRLSAITNDLFVRAGVANKSRRAQFREDLDIKLESKIIRKKELENELAKYVETAKYLQQRGFEDETARFSRSGTNKTSR